MPEFTQSDTGPRGDLARVVPESCRSFLDVVIMRRDLASFAALPGLRDLLTFQFVVLGTKR